MWHSKDSMTLVSIIDSDRSRDNGIRGIVNGPSRRLRRGGLFCRRSATYGGRLKAGNMSARADGPGCRTSPWDLSPVGARSGDADPVPVSPLRGSRARWRCRVPGAMPRADMARPCGAAEQTNRRRPHGSTKRLQLCGADAVRGRRSAATGDGTRSVPRTLVHPQRRRHTLAPLSPARGPARVMSSEL